MTVNDLMRALAKLGNEHGPDTPVVLEVVWRVRPDVDEFDDAHHIDSVAVGWFTGGSLFDEPDGDGDEDEDLVLVLRPKDPS